MRKAGYALKLLIVFLVAGSAGPVPALENDPEKLWELGEKAFNAGRYREALPYYEGSLSLCGGNLECTASDLNGIGAVYEALDDDKKALPYYEKALAAARKINNRDLVATNAFCVGAIAYRTYHQYEKALDLFEESQKIFKELDLKDSLAVVLFNEGKVLQVLGRYEKALNYFDQSLKMNKEINNQGGVAGNLNLIGNVYQHLGQLDKPLAFYQEALRINRQLNVPAEIALTLRNLGNLYCDLLERDKALSFYEEALAIQKQNNLKADIPATLNNIGALYKDLNQYAKALSYYEASLKLNRELDSSPDIASNLCNMGDVYASMGKSDLALAAYQESLSRERQINRPEKMAIVLNNIGMEQFRLGRYDQALKNLTEALNIERKLNNPHNIAARLNNIGAVYLRQGKYRDAEDIFLERKKLQASIAKTKLVHAGLVETYLALNRYDEALALLKETPPGWRDSPVRHLEYRTQYAQALRGKGLLREAAHELLQAVTLAEEMRQQAGDKEGFFSGGGYIGHAKPHRLLVSVLAERAMRGDAMDQEFKPFGGDLASAAFYFAELTKARTLLEAMAGAARKNDEPEVSPEIRARETTLLKQLADSDDAWETAYKKGEVALKEAAGKKEGLEQELRSLVSEIRARYPRYAALKYPKPSPVGELSLKPDEVLIEFALADDAGYAFVIRKGGIKSIHKINIQKEALEEKARSFMDPLNTNRPSAFSVKAAGELYEILLSKALKDVKDAEKLVIVPDGILGLLPFEAFVTKQGGDYKDSSYVGDARTVTYSQSATALALTRLLRPSDAGKPLFALGNPIYDRSDPRYIAFKHGAPRQIVAKDAAQFAYRGVTVLPKGDTGWEEVSYPPLPETEAEVRAIATLLNVKPEPPDVLLNISANETTLRQASLKDYRYLHFATHADLPGKVRGIQEPFMILGQVENRGTDDGFLTLSEVLEFKLDADMVVLSACSTGKGTMMEGEGVANFSRAFQHAGARSVVVSLWEVASEPAVEYMKAFYGYLKAGKGRAEALRLSRDEIKAKYPSPFYWAVFILHGEG